MLPAGDRCIVRLTRRWTDDEGKPQHFRGMGVFRFRDGKIAEYLVYHKRNRPVRVQDTEAETLGAVQRFCELFNRHDLDAVMDIMADDCVMDGLTPYPDGARYEGKGAVRARWEEVLTLVGFILRLWLQSHLHLRQLLSLVYLIPPHGIWPRSLQVKQAPRR